MKRLKGFKRIILMVLVCFMIISSVFAEETASLISDGMTTLSDSDFDVDVIFWNNSGYNENIAEKKNVLGVDLTIKNNSASSENVQPYVALYQNRRLIGSKVLASQTLDAGTEVSYSESISINGDNTGNYTAKVFAWSGGNLKPLSDAVSISGNKEDFYGDSIATATLLQNTEKEVNGSINKASDNDYLKIIPTKTNTYSIKTFSTTSVVGTLYDTSGTALVSDSSSMNYTLTENQTYYIKISGSGTTGDYLFAICENLPSEADTFDVYQFDADVTVYKKSILEICDDLYYEDKTKSKQMYSEYEDILDEDAKLHVLPEFLADHPKDVANFDELLNEYYGTKFNDFQEIKQRYLALIDKYTEPAETSAASSEAGETEAEATLTENTETLDPVIIKYTLPTIQRENIETEPIQPGDQIQQTPATPSLSIVSTTATSITYNVTFPVSGQWGNMIYMYDFNANDGLTVCENVYGTDLYRASGQYTISGLEPGGAYVLNMMWSTDGQYYGGENGICRFVQLPNNTTESLSLYSGGRVTARMESADKALASDANFNIWLDRMDKVYVAYKELTGYTPFDSKKIEMRSTRNNLNNYFNVVDGKNYYYIVHGYFDGTNIFKYGRAYYKGLMRRLQHGDWGWLPMHEMSHVFDNYKWIFDAETLAQLKAYYAMEQLNAKVYDCGENEEVQWYEGAEYYDYLKSNRLIQSYANSFGIGEYASEGFAALLIDIQKEIGWEPFKKTFRYFSDLSSSQVLYNKGEILKLFLTKLKDYSGEDVLGMISSRDTGIIEDWYGIILDYVEPIYPSVSGGGSSGGGGGSSEVTVDKGSYSTYQFTPTESANYYIYTSPYGGSGVSNDTYIEVYNNPSLSGTSLASNDDYDGGRFSKVSVAMTEGVTYYIKVRHYGSGQLHAELNISKNVPVVTLSLESQEDIIVANGEFALYRYTPTKSITHVFEVGNYNGGSTEYDTYIKLYGNESMTQRIGEGNKKIVVNLTAGHTYYLQFSGYLMKTSRGRISIREGQTIEFNKSADSSFIFVNSPEYITKYDIVDDTTNPERSLNKIFEQVGVTGENTYYQTHLSWYGYAYDEEYYPQQAFYLDVDFYNESAQTVTLEIKNLAHGLSYQVMGDYYTGNVNYTFTIEPGKHLLLLETINSPMLASNHQERPTLLFDFKVSGGSVTVSSLAAYERTNLYLKDNTVRTTLFNDKELGRGYPETNYSSSRPEETDYKGKYKGTAWNESAWIEAKLEFLIDENAQIEEAQPVYLRDDFYDAVANPKWSWTTALNPIDDDSFGTLSAMPGALHNFRYPSEFSGKEWYFDFLHHDLSLTDQYGSGNSVNTPVSDAAVNELRSIVASGVKQNGYAIDENAMSMGSWGATYHYTVTVTNTTNSDRTAVFGCRNFNSMTLGHRLTGEEAYTTVFHYGTGSGDNDWWEPVSYTIPANSEITFEVVTNLGVSFGGTNYHFVVR